MRGFPLLLLLLIPVISWGVKVHVVDDESGEALFAVSVFGKTGAVAGHTDAQGDVEVAAEDFPVILKCLGYSPVVCTADQPLARMTVSPITLQEVIVSADEKKPVLRMVCYMREYMSIYLSKDTLICYNEHMIDMFMPREKKVKGFKASNIPRILNSRYFTRQKSKNGVDSIYSSAFDEFDLLSMTGFIPFPTEPVVLADEIKNGARSSKKNGKYGVKSEMRRPDANTYIVKKDELADMKNHVMSPWFLKLFGISFDITELQESMVYCSPAETFYPEDLQMLTFGLKILFKGKFFKRFMSTDQPAKGNYFYEVYPVEVEYLTVDEAKEIKKNPPATAIVPAPSALPLDKPTQRLVEALSHH